MRNERGVSGANAQHQCYKIANPRVLSSYLKELIEHLLAYLELLQDIADSFLQTSLLHQGQHTTVMLHLRQNNPEQRIASPN